MLIRMMQVAVLILILSALSGCLWRDDRYRRDDVDGRDSGDVNWEGGAVHWEDGDKKGSSGGVNWEGGSVRW